MKGVFSLVTSLRLLLLSSEFPPGPGGIGTHAHQLALRLGDLGWQVEVIARQDFADDAEIAAFNTSAPFSIIRLLPAGGSLSELLYRAGVVLRRVRASQPDVILSSGQRMVWLMALLAPLLRRPWAAVGHGTEFKIARTPEALLSRFAFSRANHVICVSQHTRGVMLRAGIRPRAGSVIHNGADDTRFAPAPAEICAGLRAGLGIGDAPLIVTVGHVSPRKGQDIVVRALPHILQHHPNTHYVAVGLPTQAEAYMQIAHDLGVADHVHFVGRQPIEKVIGWMSAADVFAVTSRTTQDGDFEGYGIVVIEAAMCGVPSVVADNSGLVEAIEDGVTGIAVRHDDPHDTARGILTLLDDAALRRAMGERARARALSAGTWRHAAASYDTLLRSLPLRAAKGNP
jgi:phosphatidylinositol alpha-1,6-mannosyltransferase